MLALLDALEQAQEMVFDCFNQGCQVSWDHEKKEGRYNHDCISTWESAQEALIQWGRIREDQCDR